MEERAIHPEGKSADDFLIAQFNVLGSHIDGLFNSATQRIAAYLVFVGLVFTAVTVILQIHPERGTYVWVALLSIGLVGLVSWYRTVRLLIQVIRYFRIMGGIRGYFAERDPNVARLCTPLLSTSSDRPRWNRPVFEPGLAIIDVILSVVVALLILLILKVLVTTGLALTLQIVATVISFGIAWLVLWRVKALMMRRALDTNREESGEVPGYEPAINQ